MSLSLSEMRSRYLTSTTQGPQGSAGTDRRARISSSDPYATRNLCWYVFTALSQAKLSSVSSNNHLPPEVERATEYETSLRRINSTRSNPPPSVQVNLPLPDRGAAAPGATPNYPPLPATAATSYTPTTPANPPNSRLARLLPTRAASNAAPPSTAPLNRNLPPPTPYNVYPLTAGLPPTEANLLDALNHEQSLRLAAESAAAQTNSEIEELTGQLFEQANEMVATERKARAKLEERVEVLEKRDNDKAKRLGLLEMRVARVERVRGLLEQEKDRTRDKEAGGNKLAHDNDKS